MYVSVCFLFVFVCISMYIIMCKGDRGEFGHGETWVTPILTMFLKFQTNFFLVVVLKTHNRLLHTQIINGGRSRYETKTSMLISF